MARTCKYVQPGNTVTLVAPTGGVVAGTAYLIGSLLVIAQNTAAEAAEFEGMVTGVHEVNKVSAQAWTRGVKIYWDDTAKNFTTTLTSNTLVGAATAAAANPSSTGFVRLDGVVR
jgi:predicted RecA/RadA family phage recombinase